MRARNTTVSALFVLIAPFAAAICGDSVLDHEERCDDGNSLDGDGCSSLCQVEAGFACSDPVVAGDLNGLIDGGFETVAPLSEWRVSVVAPLCRTASCGSGSGSGAAAGNGWAWFGGRAIPASQHAEQDLVIPVAATTLRLKVENPVCDSAGDVARVLLDGTQVWSTDGADTSCGSVGYRDVTVDLATAAGGPYNDDASHTLRIEADLTAINGGPSNFFFDELLIDVGDVAAAPSVCTLERELCLTESFDALAGNFPAINWSVFNSGVVAVDWGTTDDGICNSANGPPGNHTGGTGEAACVDADAAAATAGSGQIDAYLCTAAGDFTNFQGSALEFRLIYQLVSNADAGDIFQVLAADTVVPPSAATIGSFATVYSHGGANAGEIGLMPGEHVTVDLSPLDGSPNAYICFRYGARDDWYAQIDDVSIVATSCTLPLDSDGDGVADNSDNCLLSPNPTQTDSDGDGFGNVCDADLNGDCQTNAVDLGIFKTQFFGTGPHADFNGDGIVNALDLGILKSLFFSPPGPSGTASCP